MLAHVRHLAGDPPRELAHGRLATGEGLEDAQALGVAEGSSDGGGPLSIFLGGCQVVDHASSLSLVAQRRKSRVRATRRPYLGGR